MIRGISLGKSFWVVNTWRAPVRKRFKGSTLNCTHISNRLLQNTVPAFFLIMSYSFFIAITRQALKAYFAWKQLKVDYSKNIWKEENRGHGFVCLLVGYISVKKKIIENYNSAGTEAQNIGKVASFWPNVDPNFTNIWSE